MIFEFDLGGHMLKGQFHDKKNYKKLQYVAIHVIKIICITLRSSNSWQKTYTYAYYFYDTSQFLGKIKEIWIFWNILGQSPLENIFFFNFQATLYDFDCGNLHFMEIPDPDI